MPENPHHTFVSAWLDRTGGDLTPGGLCDLLERAFAALRGRAELTLGQPTLTAILDRVLHTAALKSPLCASLTLSPTGLDLAKLRERVGHIDVAVASDAIRCVLVELLTVLGKLTAEILTPGLHATLSKVGAQDLPDEPGARGGFAARGD